jgi:hypothetical protein
MGNHNRWLDRTALGLDSRSHLFVHFIGLGVCTGIAIQGDSMRKPPSAFTDGMTAFAEYYNFRNVQE